ncbi:Lens epithelium-derived growth factor (LEDGF),PWWP domain [Cinara cedri]|uniref:Lens epithelium-derived growth factor (LEDGF),PWWP domain n=1 Tax=Cinara cedri TaxID=506608 RepID=A0A5E4MNX0_9HEMI|nr:Lens epithelium-derived growth factor (LEDGF),PWWP domain [Cinara cedri]
MASKKVFKIKDKVFAKIRGYPAWPAIISGIKSDIPSRMRYNVYFYGTGERAECKPEELFPYEENKSKLGKPSKRKYFTEALLQIEEDDTGVTVLPEESFPVNIPPSNTVTKKKEQEKPPLNESVNVKIGESNSETEGKLTTDETSTNKGKKVSTSKKSLGISISKGTKRKLSDAKLDAASKRSIVDIMKNKDNVVVQLETLSNSVIEKAIAKQNSMMHEKKLALQMSRTPEKTNQPLESNKTELVPEPSNVSVILDNNRTPKSSSKIKNSPSVNEISNNSSLGHVSRSGRKIKPKKYSDYENEGDMSKRSRTSKEFVKTEKVVKVETDNDTKDAHSNSKITKISTNHSADVPLVNDSAFKEMNQITSIFNSDTDLPNKLKKLMSSAVTNVTTNVNELNPKKMKKIDLLNIELKMMDILHIVRKALNTERANCETALASLEQLYAIDNIDSFMLIKHKEVVETIKKVTKYVGNASEWNINEEEMNKHNEISRKIRCKAKAIYNKFKSLFIVPDGKTFKEIYNKEVNEFNSKNVALPFEETFTLMPHGYPQ